MGLRAVERLNAGGIKAFKAKGDTVSEIISEYSKGNLEEITPGTACTDHNCH
jgi:predicted Fe-Mo cluster-binding NifX family protein